MTLYDLLEIPPPRAADTPPADIARNTPNLAIRLLSLPPVSTLSIFVLLLAMKIPCYHCMQFIWAGAYISLVTGLAVIGYGLFRWRTLTLLDKLLVVGHIVAFLTVLGGIALLLWAFMFGHHTGRW